MCGIAGIFAYHYAAPAVDRDELRAIRDHMTARGPDGRGEWYSENGRVGFGHRRLAIIDLSNHAAQPMASADGRLVISFNGEIYNFQALRRQLEQKGYRFRTHSDTEVLLHLYAEKGEAMVHDLRGMFAFALWDEKKQAMLLARDPYGIKPLYYADDGWTLRFASQVKAILAGGKASRQPEPAGIVGFYLFGSVPEPYTTYQDIRAVPAGSWLWVDATGPAAPVRYCSISGIWEDAERKQTAVEDIETTIREALLDSVRHHLVADVPVGAFLSAGIDSGALVGLISEIQAGGCDANASLLRKKGGSRSTIQTITVAFQAFKGTHSDESPLAATVADHYGTKHTTRYVTEREFQEELPGILDAMDQPTIDGINIWFVAKAAREQGLKVAVSGLGGDELFGGYPSFREIPRWLRWLWLPSHIPGVGVAAEKLQIACNPLFAHINPKAAGMIRYGRDYAGAYLLKRGLFLPNELTRIIDADLVAEGLRRLQPHRCIQQAIEPAPTGPYAKVAALESSLYMRNQLLRDTDWAGMAHSLEIRVPLVDVWLLRRLAKALVSSNTEDPKKLLASAPGRPLPDAVVHRAKSGFSTPISQWQQQISSIRQWRTIPLLTQQNCPWARRWAYSIIESQST